MSGTTQRPAQTAVTERYEALFRVSQSLISIRSSEELFSILPRELRAVVNFHFFRVGIYDDNAPEPRLTLYGELGLPLQAPPLLTLTFEERQFATGLSTCLATRMPRPSYPYSGPSPPAICTIWSIARIIGSYLW
jgi:hypothetical protein